MLFIFDKYLPPTPCLAGNIFIFPNVFVYVLFGLNEGRQCKEGFQKLCHGMGEPPSSGWHPPTHPRLRTKIEKKIAANAIFRLKNTVFLPFLIGFGGYGLGGYLAEKV